MDSHTFTDAPLTMEEIDAAIKAFLEAPDYEASRAVLEQQQAVLQLTAVRRLLARLEHEERRERRATLRIHIEALLLAREQTIDAAWVWLRQHLAEQQAQADATLRAVRGVLSTAEREAFEQDVTALAQGQLAADQYRQTELRVQAVVEQAAQHLRPTTFEPRQAMDSLADAAGADPPGATPAPHQAAPPVTLPAITPEQMQQIRALVAQPDALPASQRQPLQAWLGAANAKASLEEINAALHEVLKRVG